MKKKEMKYSEARKTWYDALGQFYDARWNLYEALEEKGYETDAEREELEELLAIADKLAAMYENDSEETEE